MGAESTVLQGCKLEDPLETPTQSEWKLHPAKRKDGSRVSVFVHKKSEQEDRRLENAAKQLKILRHPTILKFFASCDNVEGTYLITEQVRPLELVLESLNPEEICAGLYNVAQALSFLHDRGGASHNNVCVSSIYVSVQDGGWRLGGMEHLSKFEDATVQFLNASRPLRNADAIPPEEHDDIKTSISPEYGHARDAYAFGILAQNMLEYLTDLGSMSANFERRIDTEFLHSDPTMRPKLTTLLNDQLFKNDFLEIINFLVHLTVKSEAAKNVFFEGLAPRLHRLPRQLVANRLASLLLSSFVMAEPMAVSMVLPHFMTPLRESSNKHHEFISDQINPLFSEELFKKYLIPVILKMFASRETHVRICLLRYFSSYVDLFDVNVLKKGILPQLLIGLKDYHDELVSASLKGLADIVPILGAQVVVGGERIKYFLEGRPKFPSQKESPLKSMDNIANLTAVSGVITMPPLEKTLPTDSYLPTQPSPVPLGNGNSGGNYVTDTNAEALAVAMRQEERDKRREEMRIKNEQRRRDREAKKIQIKNEKVTLLSMANARKESVESLDETHTEELSPKTDGPSYLEEFEGRLERRTVTPSDDHKDFQKDEDDWSDWDGVNEQEGKTDQSGDSLDPNPESKQTESVLNPGMHDDVFVKSDWKKMSGDKDTASSDWMQANEKGHASSKKALQLKKPAPAKSPAESQNKTVKQNRLQSGAKNFSKRPNKLVKLPAKPTELGSEFSIPDIVVSPKEKSLEPDFFADMEPSMSFLANSRASESKKKVDSKPGKTSQFQAETEKSTSLSFKKTSTPEFEGDGWGADDDFSWDEMDS